jgi:mannitol/fructose-specific phosphotransferase system IIA component (Ntr-type)
VRIRDYLTEGTIDLQLDARDREECLARLVQLLKLGPRRETTVLRQLTLRELLGSTGFGSGVAIPHCRTLAVSRLRMAFGLHREGVDFGAVDGQPVHAIFLIIAPPQEKSNEYLPALGRLAQFLHDPEIPPRLRFIERPENLLALLEARGL